MKVNFECILQALQLMPCWLFEFIPSHSPVWTKLKANWTSPFFIWRAVSVAVVHLLYWMYMLWVAIWVVSVTAPRSPEDRLPIGENPRDTNPSKERNASVDTSWVISLVRCIKCLVCRMIIYLNDNSHVSFLCRIIPLIRFEYEKRMIQKRSGQEGLEVIGGVDVLSVDRNGNNLRVPFGPISSFRSVRSCWWPILTDCFSTLLSTSLYRQ